MSKTKKRRWRYDLVNRWGEVVQSCETRASAEERVRVVSGALGRASSLRIVHMVELYDDEVIARAEPA